MAYIQSRFGSLLCGALFLAVFVALKTETVSVRHLAPGPEYGLLLFAIPGFITAWLIDHRCLTAALYGGLLALPFCYLIRVLFFVRVRTLPQELAYAASAIFWCVLGALLFLLAQHFVRTLRATRRRT
ncbi:inner membrane protein YbjM [Nissabacter sp. SGAir0207]|uniref:inner membrane protein YbjM n=1 Tax=Nissabacter sp. SGAir0207 TaxID=2126321 RepID=UPI0010CCCD45|nr:inner membrane protein YbjM [Nissabacter sp. SGAir0207]QCR35806.1 hypothetical protein C1N62_06760 [Nissabacter sp. SGAir0207]